MNVDYSSSDLTDVAASFYFNEKELKLGLHYWDLFIEFVVLDKVYGYVNVRLPIKSFSENVIQKIKNNPWGFSTFNNENIFHPYVTVGGGKIAFLKRPKSIYDDVLYFERENQAITEYVNEKEKLESKKAWLIFEKYSQTAQDNGFYFFKYAVKKRPNVFYVIKKDSPDLKYLKEYQENVVEFMSKEHMKLLLSCEKIISSEGRGHGYAWRRVSGLFKDVLLDKEYVFLQHGVIGMKKLGNDFSKSNKNSSANKFICSTYQEKQIISKQFGYVNNELILSGLPRWDELLDLSGDINEIFLMPTWRNWLEDLTDNEFINTDYFMQYNKFLNSIELSELLKKYNFKLNFYLHPKIVNHIKEFKVVSELVQVFKPDQASIRNLIMQSKILITDYSSIAWDFIYIKKPVLFFHFDIEDYQKYQGSYIDLKTQLPSEAVYNVQALLSQLEFYIKNYDSIKEELLLKHKDIFPEDINNSSEIIFNEIV